MTKAQAFRDLLRDEQPTPAKVRAFARTLDPEDLALFEGIVGEMSAPAWSPQPYQQAPEGAWRRWMFLGGRGTGKTMTMAAYLNDYMEANPTHRARIIAPTLGDARASMVDGVSGVKALNPSARFNSNTGSLHWPGGGRARIFGASTPEDVERLRAGGNSHCDVYEELAAWRKLDECYEQADLGLRLGPRPHAVIATTPKPRKVIRSLVTTARENPAEVVITRARTVDNVYLDQSVRDRLMAIYAGTRIGRQELDAELLEDFEGALWRLALIDETRVKESPALVSIVVGVDPAVSNNEDSDHTGIVVAGRAADQHLYVLADRSLRGSPDAWARAVVAAYEEFTADRVVVEVNQGGDMVTHVLHTVAPRLPITKVHASRGKRTRAEPVSARYEQRMVHHVGTFPALEDEMVEWVPGADSPDRMDALVWALTAVDHAPAKSSTAAGLRIPTMVRT